MTTVLERVQETRMLESIQDALPECSYEGLYGGSKSTRRLVVPDKCHQEASWVARYPKCGHSEPWCDEHATQFRMADRLIICFCMESLPARKAEWREL